MVAFSGSVLPEPGGAPTLALERLEPAAPLSHLRPVGTAPIPVPVFCPAPKAIDAWVFVCVRSWPVKGPATRSTSALIASRGADSVTAPVLLLPNREACLHCTVCFILQRSSSGPGSRRVINRARTAPRLSGRSCGTGLSPSDVFSPFLMQSACPLLNLARQQTPTALRLRQKTALLTCRRSFSVSAVHVSFILLCCRTWWRSWRPWRRARPFARLRSALLLPQLAHPIFRFCLRLCPLLWLTPSRLLWTWRTRRRRRTLSPLWQRSRSWHRSPLRPQPV